MFSLLKLQEKKLLGWKLAGVFGKRDTNSSPNQTEQDGASYAKILSI